MSKAMRIAFRQLLSKVCGRNRRRQLRVKLATAWAKAKWKP